MHTVKTYVLTSACTQNTHIKIKDRLSFMSAKFDLFWYQNVVRAYIIIALVTLIYVLTVESTANVVVLPHLGKETTSRKTGRPQSEPTSCLLDDSQPSGRVPGPPE